MRLSGTYFERLIYIIIPLNLIVGGLFRWINNDVNLKQLAGGIMIITLFLWATDILFLFIKYKNPRKLIIRNNEIFYGNKMMEFDKIKKIETMTDVRFKWCFRLIKIELRNSKTIYSLARPIFILSYIHGTQTNTERILKSIPKLKGKLRVSS